MEVMNGFPSVVWVEQKRLKSDWVPGVNGTGGGVETANVEN